ncbi:MAG: hypothetical protein ACE5ER_10795 [Nitrospinaceae bacterium]
MDFNDDEDSRINEKTLVYVLAGLLLVGFISVLFIMIPWLEFQETFDWRTILLDNVIIIAIAGVFLFGFLMAARLR